jgi:hypothetical protein
VLGSVEMRARVLVLRRVTAADMAARETDPQVNPLIAHFQALFAPFSAGCDFVNFAEVRTLCGHRSRSS